MKIRILRTVREVVKMHGTLKEPEIVKKLTTEKIQYLKRTKVVNPGEIEQEWAEIPIVIETKVIEIE